MSTQIDERVVSMKFDARDFDNNVQKTMGLLDKFKNQLDFKGAQQGLEDINSASKKVNLSHLQEAALAVEAKFSVMSIAAISAINNIVNAAMNAGTQIVKSLTIDQVTSGFSKYEDKVKSVQTIMNATGLSIEEVSEQLDRLAWFTDETSYSFTDMVSNIGKFTSNNIDLQTSVTAMEGIANWAALSGQGVDEASRAMYNLSQAISVGAVKLIDWKSIENANMATTEFKQTVLDTAVSMGTLTKSADGIYHVVGATKDLTVSVTDFNSQLSSGWFSSEVLLGTLQKYGEYSDAVFERVQETGELCAEAMNHVSGATMELGEKAFKAAQEAKTFSDAIEATKDAISTGWMQTFEIIFGNYEEAKELWTELANVLYDIFAVSGEVRNEMLESWAEMGGRTELLDAIGAAYEAILSIVEPLKEAISELFPPITAETLLNITAKLRELAEAFTLNREQAYGLKSIFEVLLTPIYLVYKAIETVISIAFSFVLAIAEIVKAFLTLIATTNPIEDFFRNVFGDDRYERVMESIATIVQHIAEAFVKVGEKIKEFVDRVRESEQLQKIFEKIKEILEPIKERILDGIVNAFEALANVDFTNINFFATTIMSDIVSKLKEVSPILEGIINTIENVGKKIISYFTGGMGELSAPIDAVNTLKSSFSDLTSTVDGFKSSFNINSILQETSGISETLSNIVNGLGESFGNLVNRLEPAKVLMFAFGSALTATMLSLNKALNSFASVGEAASGVLESLSGAIDNFGSQFKPNKWLQIAEAILVLAASVAVLSLINPDRLWASVGAVAALAGVLTLLTAALAAIQKFLVKDNDISKITTAFLKIGVAVAAMAAALMIVSQIETEGLAVKIVALIGIIAFMGALVTAMAMFSQYDISANAMVIVAFAVSLLIMVNSLKAVEKLDTTKLLGSVASLLTLMGLLALLSKAMQGIKFTAAIGVTVMVGNMFLIVMALDQLRKYPLQDILNSIPIFLSITAMLAVLMATTKVAGENAQKAAVFIVALSASMLILGEAIKVIGSFDKSVAIQGTIVVGILIVLLSLLTAASHLVGEHVGKMSSNFVMLSIAILLLGLCISYIGSLDLATAIQGTIVVSVLLLIMSLMMKLNSAIIKEGEKFKAATTSMIAMGFLLGITSACLALLSLIPDQENLLRSAASLTIVITALGVAAKAMSKTLTVVPEGSRVKKTGAGLITTIGVLIAAGAALYLVGQMDLGENTLSNIIALSVLIGAISGCALLLSNMKEIKHLNTAAGMLLTLSICVGLLSGVMVLVNKLNPINSMGNAVALSLLIGAISGCAFLLSNMNEVKNLGATAGLLLSLTICVGIISGIMAILAAFNIQMNIGNAIALSILIGAISGCAFLLSNMGKVKNLGTTAGLLLSLSICVGILAGIMAIVEAFDIQMSIGNAIALSILIVAMSVSARLMQGLQSIDLGSAIQAMLAVGAGILILIGVVELINAAADYFSNGTMSAIDVFGMVGAAFGQMIGEFIGHIGEGISGSFPAICQNIVDAMNEFSKVDDKVLSGASTVALAMLALTGAELLSALTNFFLGGISFSEFGQQIAEFGPYLSAFSESVKDVKIISLTAAANAINLLAEAYANIQQTIGGVVADAIGGKVDFTSFAEDIKELAPALEEFSTVANGIDIEGLNKGVAAAQALSDLENILAKHGGFAQMVLGDADLGQFADNIVQFGYAMQHYSAAITQGSGLDTDAMAEAVKAGQALADLESSLRGHGGIFSFFGDADLGEFGAHIADFGAGLSAYSAALNGKARIKGGSGAPVDIQAIVNSVPAGQALADLEKGLGATNGVWQSIFGGKHDLGSFATNISSFGQGIADYSTKIAKVNFNRVRESVAIGELLSTLEASLPETGGVFNFFSASADFKTFGDNLGSLGKAFEKYGDSIDKIDLARLNSSVESLEKLLDIAALMNNTSSVGMMQFSAGLTNIANAGIDSFVEAFEGSEGRLVDSINRTFEAVRNDMGSSTVLISVGETIVDSIIDAIIQNESGFKDKGKDMTVQVVSGVNENGQYMKNAGNYIVVCVMAGISGKTTEIKTTIENAITNAANLVSKSTAISSAARAIGSYTVQGIITGVTSQQSALTNSITNVSKSMITTSKKVLDEHSPSVEFKTIGINALKGLEVGLEAEQNSLNNTVTKSMMELLDETRDAFDITSAGSEVMRDQIGVYLVKGIAEGITSDMSAEAAAAQKAENIVNAFKDAIEESSRSADLSELEYSIWTNRYGRTATDKELKEMEQLNYQNKLDAKGKELAAQRAALTALEMRGFKKGDQPWNDQYETVLKTENDYGSLINEYIDAFSSPTLENAINDRMNELNDFINQASRESQQADTDYQKWYNQYGKKASEEELQRMQEEQYKTRMESAGKILGANEALARITLEQFGEDSDEYISAAQALDDAIISYQEAINDYLELVDPSTLLIDKLNSNIDKYSDASTMADLNYQMWENQYGSTASEQETAVKQQEKLEAQLEAAGKTVASNQAILNLIMEKYGEDSQEYMDANQALANSIISYQGLINDYMKLMNPTGTEAADIRAAYDEAAAKYRELMDPEMVKALQEMGFSYETIQQDAYEKSGLKALEKLNTKKEQFTYDSVWDRFIPKIDEKTVLDGINTFEDLYERNKIELSPDIEFDTNGEQLNYDEIFAKYLPESIKVEIDSATEAVVQEAAEVVEKKTQTAVAKAAASGTSKGASSGAKSGVSSGLKSGTAAGIEDYVNSMGMDPDIKSALNDLGVSTESPFIAITETLAKSGLGGLNDALSQYMSTGSLAEWVMNMAQGLMRGADSASATTMQVGQKIASWVASSFTGFLGIHSPSTLMEKYAGYIDEGVANGVTNKLYLVTDAMTNLVNAMLSVTSDGVDSVQAIGKAIADGIIDGFNQTSYTIYTRISEALTKTTDLILEYDKQTYYNAGTMLTEAMINGMLDGIANHEDEAINEIVRLATDMYQAACNALGFGGGMNVAMSTLYGSVGTSTSSSSDPYAAVDDWYAVSVDAIAAQKQLAQIQATYSSQQASAIGSLMDRSNSISKLQNGSDSSSSGTTYNFYQTNNSPAALSRIDIYRDTKNLLSSAKGVT